MANGYQKYLSGEANPRDRINESSAFENDIDMEGYDEAQYEKDLAEIEDLTAQITQLTQDINEYEGRVKFHKENASDPFYRSALLNFMETGDSGPMTAYRAQKEQAAQRKAIEEQNKIEREKASNIERQDAIDNYNQADRIMSDPEKKGTEEFYAAERQKKQALNILKNRYNMDEKDIPGKTSKEKIPAKGETPEDKEATSTRKQLIKEVELLKKGRTRAKSYDDLIKEFEAARQKYPNDEELINAYEDLQDWKDESQWEETYTSLWSEKPEEFKNKAEKVAYTKKVKQAVSEGKLSKELADELLSDVSGSKTLEHKRKEAAEARREGLKGAAASRSQQKGFEAADEKAAAKKEAKKAYDAAIKIPEGRRTRKQREAIENWINVYGGK